MGEVELRSMTGFGERSFSIGETDWRIRCKTVNHKALDVRLRLPSIVQPYERELLKRIKQRFFRGHVELVLTSETPAGKALSRILDQHALDAYRALWAEASGSEGHDAPVSWLLEQDGVVVSGGSGAFGDEEFACLAEEMDVLLEEVDESRRLEGCALADVLTGRVFVLQALVAQIRALVPMIIREKQERMRGRVQEILADAETGRLEEELVYIADRMDVEEEVTRLESHLNQIQKILGSEKRSSQGKRLVFLGQELMREATTVASKAGSEDISRLSVDARVEIERLREQFMNIE